MAELNINLSNTEAQETLKPLPPGWYEAEITDSEIKQGAKGNYIRWTFDIVGHPQKVWEIMSLNPDGEAVGLKKLKTLAVVSGHPDPNYIRDTEDFHGRTCQVRLKIEEDATGAYEPKNKITAYKPSNNNSKVQAPAHHTNPPAAVTAKNNTTEPTPEEKEPEITPWGSTAEDSTIESAEMPFERLV